MGLGKRNTPLCLDIFPVVAGACGVGYIEVHIEVHIML